MSKRPSKKRSDFASQALYKQWQKRSKAAKKGWITKKLVSVPKKIKAAKQYVDVIREVLHKKPLKKKPNIWAHLKPPATESKRKSKLRMMEDENQRLRDQIEEMNLLATFIRDIPPEMLRRDGGIAFMPSRLRGYEDARSLHTILKRAKKQGVAYLRRTAQMISAEYDVPLREVYTLLESP